MAQTKKNSQIHKCFTVKCCAYCFFLPRQANSHLRNKVSHLKMNFNAKYSQQSDAAPESHFEAVKIQVTCLVKKGKTKRSNKQTWAENVVTDYDGIFCKLHTILLLLKKNDSKLSFQNCLLLSLCRVCCKACFPMCVYGISRIYVELSTIYTVNNFFFWGGGVTSTDSIITSNALGVR